MLMGHWQCGAWLDRNNGQVVDQYWTIFYMGKPLPSDYTLMEAWPDV